MLLMTVSSNSCCSEAGRTAERGRALGKVKMLAAERGCLASMVGLSSGA
jgi:hypothetical protein